MNGNQRRRKATKVPNWEASRLLGSLMRDRGWYAIHVEQASERPGTGHPQRIASRRTVYRVVRDGYVPSSPCQFEIAAVFGLLPSHLWGNVALPEPYAYLNAAVAA